MLVTSTLVARGDPARRSSSGFARVLSGLGLVVLGGLALLSAGWTALFLATVALTVAGRVRTRRRRWELDAPGAGAAFRFGPAARRSVPLADLVGVVVVDFPGATSKGIPVTRAHEEWWLVDAAGRSLGRASTEGLDPLEVERFRSALSVPFVPRSLAERAGALPEGMPWHLRRPQAALVLAMVVTIAVMVGVLAVPLYWR